MYFSFLQVHDDQGHALLLTFVLSFLCVGFCLLGVGFFGFFFLILFHSVFSLFSCAIFKPENTLFQICRVFFNICFFMKRVCIR